MEGVAAIIERIIAEHNVILDSFKSAERVANDAAALKGLEKGKDSFMPGRLVSEEGLNRLEAARAKVDQGLNDHFHWEETTLMEAFLAFKADNLVPLLKTLMAEHHEIRSGLSQLKTLVAELISGGLSHQIWEAKAYDMRAFMTNLHKTVETHAINEQRLLNDLLKQSAKN
jgi:hypothetical protein